MLSNLRLANLLAPVSKRRRLIAQRGFSLLEVVVAFAILSLSLTVVMQVFSLVSSNTARVEERRRALLVAESQLGSLIVEDVEPGHYQGELKHGFSWRAEVEEVTVIDDEISGEPWWHDENQLLVPHMIYLEVNWGARNQQQLTLQRLYLRESL